MAKKNTTARGLRCRWRRAPFCCRRRRPWAMAQTKGGDLIVAQSSNPPSLDAMVTSSQASRNITMNIYEPLFGFDARSARSRFWPRGHEISPTG
jgi:ABC-type transport system substrate-binding protein